MSKRRKTPKPRAVRGKAGSRRNAKASRAARISGGTQQGDFIEALIAASAHALGLTIDPAWRNGVKFHVQLLLDHAARVDAFPLLDDLEPAPIFHA